MLRRADNCKLTQNKLFFGKLRIHFWIGKQQFNLGKLTRDQVGFVTTSHQQIAVVLS